MNCGPSTFHLQVAPRIAAAFSGGPDSTALLLQRPLPAWAFTVNHGLRDGADAEARAAQDRAQGLGISARILHWKGVKPRTGLMEAARRARYHLLLEACWQHGCTHLWVGHHQDDQLETVVMRRARQSNWRGLAGMPSWAERAGVILARPLLHVPKAELVARCQQEKVPFVTDPMNSNTALTRARVRAEWAPLFTSEMRRALETEIAQHRARREAEMMRLGRRFESACRVNPWGGVEIADVSALFTHAPEEPDEDVQFLLSLLMLVGQPADPVRREAVATLLDFLERGGKGATLGGCRVHRQRGSLWIVREEAGVSPLDLPAGHHPILWDRRCRVDVREEAPFSLAPLGTGPFWRTAEGAGALEERQSWPAVARATSPAIWQQGRPVRLVATPVFQPFFHPFHQGFS